MGIVAGRGYARVVEPTLVYAQRRTYVILLLACLMFVAIGALLIYDPPAKGISVPYAVIGMVFFGLIGAYCAVRLIRRRPLLVIDTDGITDRASAVSAGRLRWDQIEAVTIYSVRGQRLLGVIPVNAAVVPEGSHRAWRVAREINWGSGQPPIAIPELPLPYALETLIDVMRRYNPRLAVSRDG